MENFLRTSLFLLLTLFSIQAAAQSTLKKANKEYELNAFNLAIKSYLKVLDKEPKNVEALSKLGDCYRMLNQMKSARSWYEKAIALKGVEPIQIFNYAKVLQANGEYEKAKEWFLNYGEGNEAYGKHFAQSCDFAMSMKGVPPLYQVKKEYINTASSDFGASFFKDQVVFSSARIDIEREKDKNKADWTGAANNQLYISNVDDNGYLRKPTFLQNDLKNNYNEGPVSYSPDGKWVVFTKNNFVDGTRQIEASTNDLRIYIAAANANGTWTDEKPLAFNGSTYSTGFPNFSPDGKALYFASNRPDGFGGFDIYVSLWTGDDWGTPENLGPVVNTPGDEVTPFFDGKSLFFSSNWHQGFGGLDVFRAIRTGKQFNKVYHLGNGVNSTKDDYGFIFSAQRNVGYLTSNREGGKGKEDLYRLNKTTEPMELLVLNASDKQPIADALIDFSACGEAVYKTDKNGRYSFQALEGFDCNAVVRKSGYKNFSVKVSNDGKGNALKLEVLLKKSSEEYIGKIVDARNNDPVEAVFISATETTTGQKIETQSNANGEYALALLPNKAYVLRFSKAKYVVTHKNVSTEMGNDKSILGILAFKSSSTSLGTSSDIDLADIPTTTTTTEEPIKNDPPVVTDPISSDPTEIETETVSAPAKVEEGYAIQLMATRTKGALSFDKYKALNSAGSLYSREENGFVKLRLGLYPTKAAANQAKKDIAKKGFKKVFVIKDAMKGNEVIIRENTPPTPEAPKETVTIKEEPATETPTPTFSFYKVRLAAYKNPANFKAGLVEDLGIIEKRRWKEFTIVVLGGFASKEAAELAKTEAVAAGFKGAHLVTDKGGKLRRVK